MKHILMNFAGNLSRPKLLSAHVVFCKQDYVTSHTFFARANSHFMRQSGIQAVLYNIHSSMDVTILEV